MDVAAEMVTLQAAPEGCVEHHTGRMMVLAAVLVEELCGGGEHFFLNDDLPLLQRNGRPLMCITTCLYPPEAAPHQRDVNNVWGVALPGEGVLVGSDVYNTVAHWLQLCARGEPATCAPGIKHLHAVVEGTMLSGANPVAKYLKAPPE
jgi:hypothetical protein